MIRETFKTPAGASFDIDIAPAPAGGKRYPVVVLIHGTTGLRPPFGAPLRDFAEEIAALGYLAALPGYFPGGTTPAEVSIAPHVPTLRAALDHLSTRPDADMTRLGLVGFSLGGGIAMSYIAASPAGAVGAFADFYGVLDPAATGAIAKFPPTIVFYNNRDPVVPVAANSAPFLSALSAAGIPNERHGYDDDWEGGFRHVFRPGGPADTDSRARADAWLTTHLPPVGRP
ncbi:Dienelactone hydrolase family protein [Aquisphaera giovannonii]|uniref:Dienelactone hydrolase family protein n=1 Tax=Aquisphaera giovannonii TaxID=406548 RepID=A0A5B9W3J7_9BACT|nr:dienelactone hydrolase family protein [Aquisphaera giovannonii]QEH35186.1 Dienelactone hydrolase family protein [Aquisphaera giovannonii]